MKVLMAVLIAVTFTTPVWGQSQETEARLPDLRVGDTFSFTSTGKPWTETVIGRTADTYQLKACPANGGQCGEYVRDRATNIISRPDLSTGRVFRYDPVIKRLDFPLRAGKNWLGEYKMYGLEGFTRSGTYSGRVLGKEKKVIAGQSMDVWAIHIEVKFRQDKPTWPRDFTSEGTDEIKLWYAEEVGLVVAFSSKGEIVDVDRKKAGPERRPIVSQWEMTSYQLVGSKLTALPLN